LLISNLQLKIDKTFFKNNGIGNGIYGWFKNRLYKQ